MLVSQDSLREKLPQSPQLQQKVKTALLKFWQFSVYYGRYVSTPPHKR